MGGRIMGQVVILQELLVVVSFGLVEARVEKDMPSFPKVRWRELGWNATIV